MNTNIKIFLGSLEKAIKEKNIEKIKSLIEKISDLDYMTIVIDLLSPLDCIYLNSLGISKFNDVYNRINSKSHEQQRRSDPNYQLALLIKETQNYYKKEISELNERINELTKEAEKQEQIEDKIEKFIGDFGKEAETNLSERQVKYFERSICFLLLGGAAIIAAIGISFLYMLNDFSEEIANNELSRNLLIYVVIKGVFSIGPILYIAKISFFYTTAYISESIKCENRLHAIRFGKTYLKIFGSRIEKNEVMKAFENWNISSESDFSTSKGKESSINLIEEIKKLINQKTNS